jgi:hypothetical protein
MILTKSFYRYSAPTGLIIHMRSGLNEFFGVPLNVSQPRSGDISVEDEQIISKPRSGDILVANGRLNFKAA